MDRSRTATASPSAADSPSRGRLVRPEYADRGDRVARPPRPRDPSNAPPPSRSAASRDTSSRTPANAELLARYRNPAREAGAGRRPPNSDVASAAGVDAVPVPRPRRPTAASNGESPRDRERDRDRERRPSERSVDAYEAERARRRERERARAEEEARARANQAPVKTEDIKPNKNLAVSMYIQDDGYSDIVGDRQTIASKAPLTDVADSEVSDEDLPSPPPPPLPSNDRPKAPSAVSSGRRPSRDDNPPPLPPMPPGGSNGNGAPQLPEVGASSGKGDFRLSNFMPSGLRKAGKSPAPTNLAIDSGSPQRRPSMESGLSSSGGGDKYGLSNRIANRVKSPTSPGPSQPRAMNGGGRRGSIATASNSDDDTPPPPGPGSSTSRTRPPANGTAPPPLPPPPTSSSSPSTRPTDRLRPIRADRTPLANGGGADSGPPSPHSDLTVPDTSQSERFPDTLPPDAPTLPRGGGRGAPADGPPNMANAPPMPRMLPNGSARPGSPEGRGGGRVPGGGGGAPSAVSSTNARMDRDRAERIGSPSADRGGGSVRPRRPEPNATTAARQQPHDESAGMVGARGSPGGERMMRTTDRFGGGGGGPMRRDRDPSVPRSRPDAGGNDTADDGMSVVSGVSRVTGRSAATSAAGGVGPRPPMPPVSPTVSKVDPEVTQAALADARTYILLRPSDVDRYKKELRVLRAKMEALTGKLAGEIKAKEQAAAMQKSARGDEQVMRQAKEQIYAATEKVERIIAELLKHTKRGGDLEKRLAQSVAGVLAKAVSELEARKMDGGGAGGSPGEGGGGNAKVLALEARIESMAMDMKRSDRELAAAKETAESKASAANKLVTQVQDLKMRLDEEQEAAVERDRTIAALRTELEETTVKLEYLQTKQGLNTGGGSMRGKSRERSIRSAGDPQRDFASDSGVEPFDDGRTDPDLSGSSDALRATIRELRDQLNRAQGRNAALEAELSMSPDPRTSRPDLRSAVNASMRDAILERERVKGELEEERALRRELERKLSNASGLSPRGNGIARNGGGGGARDRSPSPIGRGGSGDDLRRQLKDAVDDIDMLKRQQDSDMRALRKLYGNLSPTSTPTMSRFTVDTLVMRVEKVMREKEDLVDKVLDLQAQNESLSAKVDFLSKSADREAGSGMMSPRAVADLEGKLVKAQRDLANNEESLQDALRDVNKLTARNREMQAEVDKQASIADRYKKDLDGLQQEYDMLLKETMSKAKEQQSSASDQMRSLETSLRAETRQQMASMESKLKAAQRDLDMAQRDLEATERQLEAARLRNDQLEADLVKSKRDNEASIKSLRDAMDREGGSSRQEVTKLQFKVEELKDALADREAKLRNREADLRELDEQFKLVSDDMAAARRQLKDQTTEFDTERSRHKRQVSDMSREIAQLRQESTGKVNEYANVAKEQSSQVAKLKSTLESRDNEMRMLEEKLKQTAAAADEADRQVTRLKATLDRLNAARDEDQRDFEANMERMRKGMEAEAAVIKRDLAEKSQVLDQVRAELDRVQSQQGNMQQEREMEVNRIRAGLQSQVESLTKEVSEKSTQLDRLQQSYEKLKESHVDDLREMESRHAVKVQQLSSELQDALAKLDEEVAERKRKVRELEEAMTDLQHRYEDDMSAYERELSAIQNSADSQTSQLDSLKRQLTILEQEKANAKEQLARLAQARDAEQAAHQQVVDELRAKLGDAEGIDFAKHRALQEQVAAMEDQLAQTFDKFAKREDVLSGELEKFQEREARLQGEYDGILKEFDRLAMNFTDFDSERKKLEKVIAAQREEIADLKTKVEELTVNKIGDGESNPTVVSLRKEFRKILADVREEYSSQLTREIEEKAELERSVRSLKRDRDMAAYSMSTASVQTMALYTEKPSFGPQSGFGSLGRLGSPQPTSPRSATGKSGYFG